MRQGTTEDPLAEQLLRIARDPELRRTVYKWLGDYCHQCRNRLNSLKLGIYLAIKQSPSANSGRWTEIDRQYRELERRVDRLQTLCRPMSLSRVTLALDLLIEDRRESWTRSMSSNDRSLEFVPPAERAIASFDVERMGQALDSLVAWRAGDGSSSRSAKVRWWVEAGHAHLVWEEDGDPSPGVGQLPPDDGPTWCLPLFARIALAHDGDYRVLDDRGWRLELTWPSGPLTP
jgi:hypothetical protein